MTQQMIKVLLVEDNPGDARLIVEALHEAGQPHFEVRHIDRLALAAEALTEVAVDVILLDLSLPDGSGEMAVDRMVDAAPNVPIVIISGTSDQEFALRLVGNRVQDYLVKGQVDDFTLVRAIRYAIERNAAKSSGWSFWSSADACSCSNGSLAMPPTICGRRSPSSAPACISWTGMFIPSRKPAI